MGDEMEEKYKLEKSHIFKDISYLHFQGFKFGGKKIANLAENIKES